MSRREKHIYQRESFFYVDLSRGNKTVRRAFAYAMYGGEQPALEAARKFVADIIAMSMQDFYNLKLERRTRRDWHHPDKPVELRYIRRINTPSPPRVPFAWIVTVPGYRSRTFNFQKWGSEANALAAAMRFRDAPTDARNIDDLLSPRQNPGPGSSAKSAASDDTGQRGQGRPEA